MFFFKKIIFIITISLVFSIKCFAQDTTSETPNKIDPTKEFLKSSLVFLKQKIKESNLILNEQDTKLIQQSGNTYTIPASLRLKAIASIPVLKEQIRVHQIRFNFNNQNEFGYKIISLKKNSVFQKLGLKKSDILYQINGRKIENDKAANEIFNDLKSDKKIKINLIRSDRSIIYTYIFN
jgi:C-terminal processing protease CtpA/Prc